MTEEKICKCGCGEKFIFGRYKNQKYIKNHHQKITCKLKKRNKSKWPKERIIKEIKRIFKTNGQLWKKDIHKFNKKGEMCNYDRIYNVFGSFKNLEKESNIKFLSQKYKKTNKELLEIIKKHFKKSKKIRVNELFKLYKNKKICHPNVLNKKFRSFQNLAKQLGYKYDNTQIRKWTKEKVKNKTKKLLKKYGKLSKNDFKHIMKIEDFCSDGVIRDLFGTYEKFSNECCFSFRKIPKNMLLGKNEKKILDYVEQKKNIILLRQYNVDKYWVDGYDKKNNIVYEVDEPEHISRIKKDKIRECKIKKILNCKFVRIDEQKYLEKIK